MENRLYSNLMLSLKEMAFRRIGVAICNKPSLFNTIANIDDLQYATGERIRYYLDIEDSLPCLRLPQSLNNQMKLILKSVCDEIARWKFFHEGYFGGGICVRVFKKLRWTTAGTINYQKTAEELLRCSDASLDVAFRFHLACFYCLGAYIPPLWREMPVESKRLFYDGDVSHMEGPHLELFLPNILRIAKSRLLCNEFLYYSERAPPSNSIELAACLGNKTLVDYYLAKLSKVVKETTLIQTARAVIRFRNTLQCFSFNIERNLLSSVSCHLLSLMTAEEQNRLFKELPCEVLSCFLDWPRQNLYLDIADVMWTFLPDSKYEHLLRILENDFNCPVFCFRNLFHGFFQRSPVVLRKRFVDRECENGWFFWSIISEDAETIRCVLRNLDPSDRKRFVFSNGGSFLILNRRHDWPSLEVFLREVDLTREEKRRLKENVTEYVRIEGDMSRIKWGLRDFFEFLEEGEASVQSKRSSEGESSTGVKKLCIEEEEKSSQ